MDLSEKRCKPCEGGIDPLKKSEIKELRKLISDDWIITEDKKISKEFMFVNYRHTMDFVSKVADLAEKEGHHPVIHAYYGEQ